MPHNNLHSRNRYRHEVRFIPSQLCSGLFSYQHHSKDAQQRRLRKLRYVPCVIVSTSTLAESTTRPLLWFIHLRFSKWFWSYERYDDDRQSSLGGRGDDSCRRCKFHASHRRMSPAHFLPPTLKTLLESFFIARSLCPLYQDRRFDDRTHEKNRLLYGRVSTTAHPPRDSLTMETTHHQDYTTTN